MNLALATKLAEELIFKLRGPDPCCDDVVVAGSIRRHKAHVGDIDLVILPTPGNLLFLKNRLWKIYGGRPEKFGDKYICLENYRGIQVDVYVAYEATFPTLMLIRTGSKEHNILLTTRAQALGMMLHADGRGLQVMQTGQLLPIRSEEEIFTHLDLPYKEPWEREA